MLNIANELARLKHGRMTFRLKKAFKTKIKKKYMKSMELMKSASNFDELFKYNWEWINGRIKGYGYSCYSTLDEIDGGLEFIELLRYVTMILKMVTISSQPCRHSFQKSVDKPVIVYSFPSELGKKDSIKEIEILYKPYITGLVTIDTFINIFKIHQEDLSIIGRLPLNDTTSTLDFIIDSNIYNIQYNQNYHIFYKNTKIKDDGIILTNFIFHCKEKTYHANGYGIWFCNYGISSEQYLEAKERKEKNIYDWRDYELCEIIIFKNDFNCNQQDFESMIKRLCKKFRKYDG